MGGSRFGTNPSSIAKITLRGDMYDTEKLPEMQRRIANLEPDD